MRGDGWVTVSLRRSITFAKAGTPLAGWKLGAIIPASPGPLPRPPPLRGEGAGGSGPTAATSAVKPLPVPMHGIIAAVPKVDDGCASQAPVRPPKSGPVREGRRGDPTVARRRP